MEAFFQKFEKDWGLNNNLEELTWMEGHEQWVNKECDIGTCHDTFVARQKQGKDLNAEVIEEFLETLPSVYNLKFEKLTIGGVHPGCRERIQKLNPGIQLNYL